jgi:hypothetical protein
MLNYRKVSEYSTSANVWLFVSEYFVSNKTNNWFPRGVYWILAIGGKYNGRQKYQKRKKATEEGRGC